MASIARRWAPTLAGLVLACAVFAFDRYSHLQAAVAVLYLVVLAVGSFGGGPRTILAWSAGCAGLAIAAFTLTHLRDPDPAAALRLLFSLVATAAVSALLLNRVKLQQLREALQESEANAENMANSVPAILWRGYADGSCDYLNQRFTEITGMEVAAALADQTWGDPIHPDDRDEYIATMMACFAAGEEFRFPFRLRYADGSYRRALTVGRPKPDPRDPSKIVWYGGVQDVHAEFEAYETIRELNRDLKAKVETRAAEVARSQGMFRTLFHDANIACAEQDVSEPKRILDSWRAAGFTDFWALVEDHPEVIAECLSKIRTIDVNAALLRMMGYQDRQELIAMAPTDNAEDAVRIMTLQLEALFEGRRHFTGTATLVGKDDRRVPIIVGVNVDPEWRSSLSTMVDISEQKNAHDMMIAAREELARANRIATVGALSVSLAHEINQPLLALSVDIRTCMRWLAKDPPAVDEAVRIVDRLARNADRATDIVRTTRERLTKGRRTSAPLDLCALIEETKVLLERDLSSRQAQVEVNCPAGLPAVMADRIEVQQVLINLLINAGDAMTAVPAHQRRMDIVVSVPDHGEEVVVAVRDHGPGVAPEDAKRIFEPFFTTKATGIGMGLQICRSIIEAFGGSLTYQPADGGGALFRFSLPTVEPGGA